MVVTLQLTQNLFNGRHEFDDFRVPILANLDVAQPAEQHELELEYRAVVAALLGTALLHRDDLIQVCT
jgi:hypothetical protein